MRRHRAFRLAVQVGLVGLLGSAVAAGPLSKQEVMTLLSGAAATQRQTDVTTYMSGARVEYGADGRVTSSYTGGQSRGFVEHGTWRVTENGQLCITWQGKSEGPCQYLVPRAGGVYDITADPARSGKYQIIGVSK
jgi:hypothetical protein